MKVIKSAIMAAMLMGVLFSSPLSKDVQAAENTIKDINIINNSTITISQEDAQRKNIKDKNHKNVTIGEKNKDKVNVLLFNKNDKVMRSKKELAQQFDLVATIDDSFKDTLKLEWEAIKNGHHKIGNISIKVDINGYKEENVDLSQYDETQIRNQTIIDAINDTLEYVNMESLNNTNSLAVAADYNWKLVESNQVAEYSVPYGISRLNYNIKKAVVENGSFDHFESLGSSTQVNPGAQLCSSNSNYECKYQVENIHIVHQPNTTNLYSSTMIEHKPVNTGSSGSSSFDIGAGYGKDGITTSVSYSFSQNWTSISVTDNSNSYGSWDYAITGDTQKQVVTVEAGSIHIYPENYLSATAGLAATVTFDSWNTYPVTNAPAKEKYFSW
jgi:hypothetical protein